MATRKRLSVVVAVEKDVAALGDLAGSALAASALALARELDSTSNSATSKAMCARALIDTLNRLRELAPDNEGADGIDELGAKRAARRARSAGT